MSEKPQLVKAIEEFPEDVEIDSYEGYETELGFEQELMSVMSKEELEEVRDEIQQYINKLNQKSEKVASELDYDDGRLHEQGKIERELAGAEEALDMVSNQISHL